MKWTYLLLDLFVILGPLALSFDSRVHYFSKWKYVFQSTILVAIPFLIWDYFFTAHAIWGFNDTYISGIHLGGLPIEEILFFIVVPFACTFIYECCKYYMSNWRLQGFDTILRFALLGYIGFLLYNNPLGIYTLINAITGIGLIAVWFLKKKYNFIGITYMISMIPFLLMNGILTGAITDSPVVWYNDLENVSLRIYTIPMEDVIYGMTLILSVIFIYEALLKRSQSSAT